MVNSRDLSILNDINQLSDEELFGLQGKIQVEIQKRNHNKLLSTVNVNRFYIPAKPDAKQQAAKLLWYVNRADYDEIEKLCNEDLSYMLLEVADQHGNVTTPLKQAIFNLDTYTYKMYYERIKNNPDRLREYISQVQEQQAHVDLQPLNELYNQYYSKLQTCTTKSILQDGWQELGVLQQTILPVHMIREFCRNNVDFSNRQFDIDKHPAPKGGTIWIADAVDSIKSSSKTISIDSGAFCSAFGRGFTLLRGGSGCYTRNYTSVKGVQEALKLLIERPLAKTIPDIYSPYQITRVDLNFRDCVEIDANTFKRLNDARINDLNALRSELQQIADLNKIVEINRRPT